MEDVTVLLLILAFILFLTRYVRKRESLDFISMITSLLSLIAVIMDETLTDNERLVLFFIPFMLMMFSAIGLLDRKKW